MYTVNPSFILGFHSCDKEIGMKVLTGQTNLKASDNSWDWLGDGIYFWEQNPGRALQYAKGVASGTQFNKGKIYEPLVLGAILNLKNCLNLTEDKSLGVLNVGYQELVATLEDEKLLIPKNEGNNRKLDCAVIRFIHKSNIEQGLPAYDSVRGAFYEGEPVYPGSSIFSQTHLQVSIRNPDCILGYFLPRM